ncbi:hypothetical protein SVAN01_10985 [Stagonosporopsis vannaccii]|nr:hypothetical protein SVAN01_10985 [Stagonosporopsis vannaccii]
MSPGSNVCGLPRCGRLLNADPVPCRECLDVPYDDVFGIISSHVYCSIEHLSADKDAHAQECQSRTLWRYMVRIGAILDLLFMCHQKSMFDLRIGEASPDFEGHLKVNVSPAMIIGEPLTDREMDIPDNIVLGALSFDQCRRSIVYITPLLKWLIKGHPLKVREQNLDPKPKDGRPWVYFASRKGRKFADIHTVITLTSDLPSSPQHESLTLDPTSMQYGRRVKGHQTFEYFEERARAGPQTSHDFGHTWTEWKKSFWDMRDRGKTDKEFLISQIAIAKRDRVIWQILQRVGGRAGLFTVTHPIFLSLMNEIERLVTQELQLLRTEIQRIRAANGKLDSQLKEMLEQYVHRDNML